MAALLHVHTSTAQLLSRGRLSQIPRLNLATQKLALVPCRRSVPISTRPLDSGARATSGQSAGPSEQRKEEAGTGKPWAGRQAGYMPFEYVNFTENHMTHEVSVEVRTTLQPVLAACPTKPLIGIHLTRCFPGHCSQADRLYSLAAA